MKRFLLVVVFVSVLLIAAVACQAGDAGNSADTGDKKVNLDSENAKVSYAIGFNMGQNIRSIKDTIEVAVLVQGIKDGFAGDDKAQLPAAEIPKVLRDFQMKRRKVVEQQRKELSEKNKKEGPAFLAENAKKEGVITTKSGLQYMVLKQGTGAVPKATDSVKVHYRGTLIDGTEFDSSYKRGKPAEFPLNRVIAAWTEGLQLMKVGAKYRFFAPANLAYGERGRGMQIGPHAVLIFDVELLSILPPAPKKELPKKFQVKEPPKQKKEQKKETQKE